MTAKHIKRMDVSVHDRLLAIARRERLDFNAVLNLYYQERFLARLSATPYRQRFLLKGGLLLFALTADRQIARPTKDVDFRGAGLTNNPDQLGALIADICSISMDDGVKFHTDRATVHRIAEDADYAGVRVLIPVNLGSARGRLQVDVGFGDVITPAPREMDFPVLLEGMPEPRLRTYSLETVVSEKFEAMISLSLVNTRMKDFFDVSQIAHTYSFEAPVLAAAIRNTFEHRRTPFRPDPILFRPEFAQDETRQRQWTAFLRRSRLSGAPAQFAEIMQGLTEFLYPAHEACVAGQSFMGTWRPEQQAWE